MNLANFVKKNGLALLIVGVAVGLVVYMTQRNEGFTIKKQSMCKAPNSWNSEKLICHGPAPGSPPGKACPNGFVTHDFNSKCKNTTTGEKINRPKV